MHIELNVQSKGWNPFYPKHISMYIIYHTILYIIYPKQCSNIRAEKYMNSIWLSRKQRTARYSVRCWALVQGVLEHPGKCNNSTVRSSLSGSKKFRTQHFQVKQFSYTAELRYSDTILIKNSLHLTKERM